MKSTEDIDLLIIWICTFLLLERKIYFDFPGAGRVIEYLTSTNNILQPPNFMFREAEI